MAARAKRALAGRFATFTGSFAGRGREVVEHRRERRGRERFGEEAECGRLARDPCERFAEIARFAVGDRDDGRVDAPGPFRRRNEGAPAHRDLSVVARRERVAAHESRDRAEIISVERT
jgi:hypothetical protein